MPSSIFAVLDADTLINILYTSIKFQKFPSLLKALVDKESVILLVPSYVVEKELTKESQRKVLKKLLQEKTIKIENVKKEEIDRYKRENLFLNLGSGEISMAVIVEKYCKNGEKCAGFTNDKVAAKKLSPKILLLHGIWFYTRMFYHTILDKTNYEKILKTANEDMKIRTEELIEFEKEYMFPVSLKERIDDWIDNRVVNSL